MSSIPGLPGEYLWELDIAKSQLLALAAAVPETVYCWNPPEGARSFGAILVHIATVNFGLLRLLGVRTPGDDDLYPSVEGGELAQVTAMVRANLAMERSLTDKAGVNDFLCRSFVALAQSFAETHRARSGKTRELLRRAHDRQASVPASPGARPRAHGPGDRVRTVQRYQGTLARSGSSLGT